MWHALGDLIAGSDDASGRLILDTRTTQSGTVRRLLVTGHKDIAETLAGLPLVYADATLPFDLVKHYLPNLWLACDINVAAPYMRITQVIGLPVGKASLQPLPPGKRSTDEEERVGRKRQRLVDAVRHLVQGRRGLVITYKSIEDDFRQIAGVEVAHFNAIEGIDRWKDVDVLIIIGRPLPGRKDITCLAAAITGKPVVEEASIEQARGIKLRGRRRTRPDVPGLCRARCRDDPAGRHRGGDRAGRRAGAGRQPDGGQPGRGLPDPQRHRGARP